jgi:hypothetical protein
MKTQIFIGIFALMVASHVYAADRVDGNTQALNNCIGNDCKPKTKEVCFNLYCNYEFEEHGDHAQKSCSAASTFRKQVTLEGAEVPQTLDGNLEVKCDGQSWYGRADIFTGLLGTRIEGKTGPDPAIFLPRGALNAGSDGLTQGHYSDSGIEITEQGKFTHGRGKCFIWTTQNDNHGPSS